MSYRWEHAVPRSGLELVSQAALVGQDDLAIGVVEEALAFDALEREWNALLERSEASVFQSFEWQRTWWRHFGEGRSDARLHLVTVRDRDGLVAAAPLYVETVRVLGVWRLRRLLFVGRGDSDYLDIVAARGREAQCVDLVATQLARHPDLFDVAVLEDSSDRSRTGPLLHEAFVRRGWVASRFVAERCPQTPLRGTWEETVAGFRIHHRREIRRRLRNIANAHRVELEVVPPGAEVEPAMREFIDMHQERWAREGYWGAFADPRVAAFHCEVANRLSRRGWLFLAFLRVDGERRAGNYAFSFRDVLATFQGGVRHAPELVRFSPGRVLHARSMEWAIAHGKTRYDFMRGPELYKYDFDASDVPNWTIVAYPRSPRVNAAKRSLHVLLGDVLGRAGREAHALRVVTRKAGWSSPAVARHLARVARRGVSDLSRALREAKQKTREA